MRKWDACIISIFLFFSFSSLMSQVVGVKFVFLTVHPRGNSQAQFIPNKLDDEAHFVPNWGTILSYQKYFYKRRWSLKLAQGMYSDCAELFAGHTHLGLRINVLSGKKHTLEFGFGPTFVYRQSWSRFEGYTQEVGILKDNGRWQKAFVWYGGEIDYDYKIRKNLDLSINIIPGPPDFLTFSTGIRLWLNPVPHNRDAYWKTHKKLHFLN